MKALVSSILLVVLAVVSTGCVAIEEEHPRRFGGHPPIIRPERPHGHDYGPPERHGDYPYDRGRR
jgi:hypothetical protein